MTQRLQNQIMNSARRIAVQFRVLLANEAGQDMIEYALMAAAIAIAVAAIFPQTIAPDISSIFSRVNSSLGAANN